MNRIGRFLIGSSLLMALIAMITPSAESAPPPSVSPTAALLVTGLQGATGSTVGPDGALITKRQRTPSLGERME